MRKVSIQKIKLVIATLCCSVVLVSCSKWDDFKTYTRSGEIIYTGKMDSVAVFSGKNRVRLIGKIKGDPNIVKAKIYWNDNQDSIVFDITPSGSAQAFDQIFAVDEGTKNFIIYTIDKVGNKSVAVSAAGTSFGNIYRKRSAIG